MHGFNLLFYLFCWRTEYAGTQLVLLNQKALTNALDYDEKKEKCLDLQAEACLIVSLIRDFGRCGMIGEKQMKSMERTWIEAFKVIESIKKQR